MVRKCGKDSLIPAITFLLYHLADNPDKQELLYQEICATIGPEVAVPETALAKMKYMKACQTESQRILPTVFRTVRRAEEGLVIGGYEIPKKTTVLRCGSMSSNDPANFPNPDKFLPERWLRGCPERHDANLFANIPFGHGAR